MKRDLVHARKARPGDRIAVISPSFAAAGAYPTIHEQAMRRLTEVTGLVPVEYPTTRKVGATPQARAADINTAFADPHIRGILAVIHSTAADPTSRSFLPLTAVPIKRRPGRGRPRTGAGPGLGTPPGGVTAGHLAEIERRVSVRMVTEYDLDVSAVALDMTNFATYLATGNPHATLAQRGKANRDAPTCALEACH